MREDELEMFCNLYRYVAATDYGSGHMKSGQHKFCSWNNGFPSMHDFHKWPLQF